MVTSRDDGRTGEQEARPAGDGDVAEKDFAREPDDGDGSESEPAVRSAGNGATGEGDEDVNDGKSTSQNETDKEDEPKPRPKDADQRQSFRATSSASEDERGGQPRRIAGQAESVREPIDDRRTSYFSRLGSTRQASVASDTFAARPTPVVANPRNIARVGPTVRPNAARSVGSHSVKTASTTDQARANGKRAGTAQNRRWASVAGSEGVPRIDGPTRRVSVQRGARPVFQMGAVFPGRNERRRTESWRRWKDADGMSDGRLATPREEPDDPFQHFDRQRSTRSRGDGRRAEWRDEDTPVDSLHEDAEEAREKRRSIHEERSSDEESMRHEDDRSEGGRDLTRNVSSNTEGTGQLGGPMPDSHEDWAQVDDEVPEQIRSMWSGVRFTLREPLAEFLGMLVLICIGVASDCQVRISQQDAGSFASQNFSWGIAVMTGIYIAGGISGGHLNPAITVALSCFRGFPWRMVPGMILAQTLGAYCGGLIVYGQYQPALNNYDPGKHIYSTQNTNATAPLFITVPNVSAGGTKQGFFQEVLATAILSIVVLALGDENNAPPGAGLGAAVLGLVVTAIGMSMGWISGYAINPARDFGPRLALWTVGFGTKLWTHDSCWWIVGPICGSLVGALIGCLAYDVAIFQGAGSPVNSNWTEIKHSLHIPAIHNMVRAHLVPSNARTRVQAKREVTLEAGKSMRHELRQRQGKAKEEQRAADLHERYKGVRRKIRRDERAQRQERQRKIDELVRSLERQEDQMQREAEES